MTRLRLTLGKAKASKGRRRATPRFVKELLFALCTIGDLGLKGRLAVRVLNGCRGAWEIDLARPDRGARAVDEDGFRSAHTRITHDSAPSGECTVDGDRGVLQIIATHLRNFESAVLS